jgi:hypothetical protein
MATAGLAKQSGVELEDREPVCQLDCRQPGKATTPWAALQRRQLDGAMQQKRGEAPHRIVALQDRRLRMPMPIGPARDYNEYK